MRLGSDLESSWGRLGAVLGPSWGHLGASWGHLGASWGPLGASLGALGAILGPSWGHLEHLETQCPQVTKTYKNMLFSYVFGTLRASKMRPSWAKLGLSCLLEPSWSHLGGNLDATWPILPSSCHLESNLDATWTQHVEKWHPSGAFCSLLRARTYLARRGSAVWRGPGKGNSPMTLIISAQIRLSADSTRQPAQGRRRIQFFRPPPD